MKRTILGLIVTSLLLTGCSLSGDDDSAPQNELTSSVTSQYLTETKQNLTGICVAIMKYGLPADEQTATYVRDEVGQLELIATEQPDLETASGETVAQAVEDLAGAYERCDPDMGAEIRTSAQAIESNAD